MCAAIFLQVCNATNKAGKTVTPQTMLACVAENAHNVMSQSFSAFHWSRPKQHGCDFGSSNSKWKKVQFFLLYTVIVMPTFFQALAIKMTQLNNNKKQVSVLVLHLILHHLL